MLIGLWLADEAWQILAPASATTRKRVFGRLAAPAAALAAASLELPSQPRGREHPELRHGTHVQPRRPGAGAGMGSPHLWLASTAACSWARFSHWPRCWPSLLAGPPPFQLAAFVVFGALGPPH